MALARWRKIVANIMGPIRNQEITSDLAIRYTRPDGYQIRGEPQQYLSKLLVALQPRRSYSKGQFRNR